MKKELLFKTFVNSKRYSDYFGEDSGSGNVKCSRKKYGVTKYGGADETDFHEYSPSENIQFFIKEFQGADDYGKRFDVFFQIIKDFDLIIKTSGPEMRKINVNYSNPYDKIKEGKYKMHGVEFVVLHMKGTLEEVKAQVDKWIKAGYNKYHAEINKIASKSWALHISEGKLIIS